MRGQMMDYPLTLTSILERARKLHGKKEIVTTLMAYGGFPEPFVAQSDRALRRWQKERLERFFREDVRDLETIRDLASLQLMADMLVERGRVRYADRRRFFGAGRLGMGGPKRSSREGKLGGC